MVNEIDDLTPEWVREAVKTGVSKPMWGFFLKTYFIQAHSYLIIKTTILAAEYNGGVIIAADSRTTSG